ncbi:hypothetical protein ACFS7Z_09550 [Pontibacter toksunensis]|uniref:GMC oxidoreductase n=1 Tax=Pontibacter toksunensis TaxID=1332631 RepID=A0ABW6BUD3_9BACT
METDFDAIVIGSGISQGWAAEEMCEAGLKTLVLERGSGPGYKAHQRLTYGNGASLGVQAQGQDDQDFIEENPIVSKAAGFGEDTDPCCTLV